jgi:homoserine dehydrogenase
MKELKIGLLGCGTVGTGVAKLLLENQETIQKRLGVPLALKYVADLDTTTDRGLQFDEGVFISNANQVVEDPEIDIIVEMIGGEGFAKDIMLKALAQGKAVVTANKALLAKHGNTLCRAAADHQVDLAFEASVGGCMPVIKTLRESLVGDRIESMIGILNGTCNYILTRITDEGLEFADVLAQAQQIGYAEADPSLDIGGFDAAHKLAIISALAYGMQINFDDIYIEGISQISPLDIEFAAQFGYRIKLLAISKNNGDAVEARVHPTMIPFANLLSSVQGPVNALTISGDAVGDITLKGYGAGMMPTASAVISDIVDLARNLLGKTHSRIPVLAFQPNVIKTIPVLPIANIETRYYFRFAALDQPGVLSKISGILGTNGISLKSVHQKGRKSNGSVPLVMLTHLAREADVQNALQEIKELDIVGNDPMLIRIEDESSDD